MAAHPEFNLPPPDSGPLADDIGSVFGSADEDTQARLARELRADDFTEPDGTSAELPGPRPFRFAQFETDPDSEPAAIRSALEQLQLKLDIELGRTHLSPEAAAALRSGTVVPLEALEGDPVDVVLDGKLIARGELLVVGDRFCIRVSEMLMSRA